jgi:hypothetical protein
MEQALSVKAFAQTTPCPIATTMDHKERIHILRKERQVALHRLRRSAQRNAMQMLLTLTQSSLAINIPFLERSKPPVGRKRSNR